MDQPLKTIWGEFALNDIILRIREFLTDKELLYFNRLSSVFSGQYDDDNQWHYHQIQMNQLSFKKQFEIYRRIEKLYYNKSVMIVSKNWHALYYCINDHFLAPRFFYSLQPLPSEIFENAPLTKNIEMSLFLPKSGRTLDIDIGKYARRLLPDSSSYSEKCLFKFLPDKLPNRMLKCVQEDPDFYQFLFIIGCTVAFVLIVLPYLSYNCNQRLSHCADIKFLRKDIWSDRNIIDTFISCNKALSGLNISLSKNFSQLMSLAGFSIEMTTATLAACSRVMGACLIDDEFSAHTETVNDLIIVGCRYAQCEIHDLTIFMCLMFVLLVSFATPLFILKIAIDSYRIRNNTDPVEHFLKKYTPIYTIKDHLEAARALRENPILIQEKSIFDRDMRLCGTFFKNIDDSLQGKRADTDRSVRTNGY